MAKLYFYYSTMNAGKSTALLQSSHNYRERGMTTMILIPVVDDRAGEGVVRSRIGIETSAVPFAVADDLYVLAASTAAEAPLHCVLVDEAQFLTRAQVFQLTEITDRLSIPVLAYGLRTDFQGELFEGSRHLLAWADNLKELKTICHCGRKATMVVRIDDKGQPVREGSQVEIGGNDRYVSTCRVHYKDKLYPGDAGPMAGTRVS